MKYARAHGCPWERPLPPWRKDDDDIVNMLQNMVTEGKQKIDKLLNMLRAATAPTSRAELPTKCEGGGCTAPEPPTPRVTGQRGGVPEAEDSEDKEGWSCGMVAMATGLFVAMVTAEG